MKISTLIGVFGAIFGIILGHAVMSFLVVRDMLPTSSLHMKKK